MATAITTEFMGLVLSWELEVEEDGFALALEVDVKDIDHLPAPPAARSASPSSQARRSRAVLVRKSAFQIVPACSRTALEIVLLRAAARPPPRRAGAGRAVAQL